MGKELYSVKVAAGRHTYFFDVKESKEGKYVAITQTTSRKDADFERVRLIINLEHLKNFRKGFEAVSDYVSGLPVVSENVVQRARQEYPRAFQKWDEAEEKKVKDAFMANKSIEEIAAEIERKPSAVRSRLVKMGLIKE